MHSKRPKFVSICLLALALSSLTGCWRQEPEPTITLTWWVTYAEDSAEYPTFEAIAKAYTAQSGHDVKLVAVPWSDIAPRGYGSTQLALEQEAGAGPDVWGPVPHNWTGGFVAESQVLALERKQIDDVIQYLDAALWACQVDDRQYGVPVLIDTIALIYNKKLAPAPPASFQELLDLARAQTDAAQDRWGLVLPLLSQYHTYPFIEGYGGYVFGCDRAHCALDDLGLNNEGAVRGVQLLVDLYLKEKLFPEPLADRETMTGYARQLFTSGRAAMLIDGSWALDEIRASGIDYGVATIPPLPGATRPPRPFTIVQAMYVGADSTHPDQAIELVNWIANAENVRALGETLGKIPVRRDILRAPDMRSNHEIQAWYEQAKIGRPLPNMLEMDSIWYPWGYALDTAIPGLVPVQDALDRAVDEFTSYFQDTE